MLIHPLNLQLLAKRPPQLFYWPIYSLNYSQLPNQYFSQSHVKTLIEKAHVTHMTFKYKPKITQMSKTQWKEEKRTKSNGERERIHTVQSHCKASRCRLATLVPAAPWWFRRIVQSGYLFFFFFFSFFPSYVLLFNLLRTFIFLISMCEFLQQKLLFWFNFWVGSL